MKHALILGSFVSLFVTSVSVFADDAVYFRRNSGIAAVDEQSLPTKFDSKQGYLWRQELAPGNSTPSVINDHIFLTTYREKEKQLATVALDRASGQVLWEKVAPTSEIEPFHAVGSPASATPASDGQRIYSFFGSYGLLCYGLDGNLIWSRRLGPYQDEFGASSSPILVDGKVILNEDHDINSHLMAIDQQTGDVLWKVSRPEFTRSYSTPIVWETGGSKQLVVAGALQLKAYNISDGAELWRVRGLSRILDTTPVTSGGMLYLATWTPGGDPSERISMEPFPEAIKSYDKNENNKIDKSELPEGAVLQRFFRIDLNQDQALDEAEWNKHARVFEQAQNVAMAVRPGGKGDVTDTHVAWTYRRGLPVCPSPLVYRGTMYMIKDGGILTALDARTGEPLKQGRLPGRGNYYASLVGGDGKVYAVSERGVLSVIRAGGDWKVIADHDFGERIMATPVIADGRIYLRTEKALYCFGER